MLPASSSAQNLQSFGLQPPPLSRSHVNLAASAGPASNSGSSNNINNNNSMNYGNNQIPNPSSRSSPNFLRSASTGVNQSSHVQQPHGLARSASDMPPSPSLRMRPSSSNAQVQGFHHLQPRSASGSHTPTQPTFSHDPPSLHHSASASHFGVYDSRLVANTINKIESSSTAGTLVSATSGATGGTGNAPPGSSHGPENDAWTAACIRTLPLL